LSPRRALRRTPVSVSGLVVVVVPPPGTTSATVSLVGVLPANSLPSMT